MADFDYPEPVSKLLTLGDCREMRQWPDYLALGIGPEHIPDLIRMVQDDELNQADPQSLEVWAPVHAWRTLGQRPGLPLLLDRRRVRHPERRVPRRGERRLDRGRRLAAGHAQSARRLPGALPGLAQDAGGGRPARISSSLRSTRC